LESNGCLNLLEPKQQAFVLYFCLNVVDHPNMTRRKPAPSTESRVWGYCRVSTLAQANEGFSLDDQKSRITGYCQANALPTPTAFFVDAATSGTISLQKREQGQRMLESLRRGDHIVVTRGDRLFRSAKNALEVAEALREKGVELHLMDMGGPCLQSSVSRLVFGILMMVANMESERIGERTASVKEHLRKQGRFVGGILPVGYKKTKDGHLLRDRDWKRHAAQMRKLSDEGLSVRKIAAEMKLHGLQLSYSTVYAVLTDKRKVDAVQ
jgi:putative DNA-invertase from lambdoid prophage Rac